MKKSVTSTKQQIDPRDLFSSTMLLNQRKSKDKIPLLRVPDVSVEDLHKHVEHSTIKTVSSGYVKVAVVALFFGMSVLFYRLREGWGIADSFLFVIITISTVGYGTIHPTTNDSRVYTIFLMVPGVVEVPHMVALL